jgi:hypothetical protein
MSNHDTTEHQATIDPNAQLSAERELENHELSDVLGGAFSLPSLPGHPTSLANLTHAPVLQRPTINTNPLIGGFKQPVLRPGGLDPIGPYSDSIGVGVGCVSWSKDI